MCINIKDNQTIKCTHAYNYIQINITLKLNVQKYFFFLCFVFFLCYHFTLQQNENERMKKVSEEKMNAKTIIATTFLRHVFYFISFYDFFFSFFALFLPIALVFICTIEHSTIQINVLQTVSVSQMIYVVYFLATELFIFYILCSFLIATGLFEFKNDFLFCFSIVHIRFIE